MEPRVTTHMEAGIAETVAHIRELASPVVRSCHIGNNTANVWGWLSYAGNARLVQYDHTLYGLDTHCLPWAVLGDAGRVLASYAPDGRVRHEDIDGHVTDMLARLGPEHRYRLMHGVFVDHAGEDLMLRHRRVAARLAGDLNGSEVSFDALELARRKHLVGELLRYLGTRDELDAMFDRWVRLSRRGHAIIRGLRDIRTDRCGLVRVVDLDGAVPFEGPVDDLIDAFVSGIEAVAARLVHGSRYTGLGYPWITLPFAYAVNAVFEAAADPAARTFWHAAGSASQYYVNEPAFQQRAARLFDILEAGGFLPRGSQLRMIPTFSFQLFALTDDGAMALDDLLAAWRTHLRTHRAAAEGALAALATTTDPHPLAAAYADSLDHREARRLLDAVGHINSVDRNTLPVAHGPGQPLPRFTAYGLSQESMTGCRPLFPETFGALTTAEAELLVNVLAHLVPGEASRVSRERPADPHRAR